MLYTRIVNTVIEAVSSREDSYIVLFDYDEGNLDKWNSTWDEPQLYPSVAIVSVYEFINQEHCVVRGQDVTNLVSDEEYDELCDKICELEDNE